MGIFMQHEEIIDFPRNDLQELPLLPLPIRLIHNHTNEL